MNTFFFDDVQYPEGLFGGKDFFNPIIYSTEEREVGVWIDNKPLYAKSFTLSNQLTVSASSWTNTDLLLADVEKFVNGYAISDDGTFQGSVVVDKSNDVIQLQSTRSTASYVKYLTVFYTKTTDVAGSGSYTTLGVPAHHYDGNEKIVGTWFGATLYEKTINTTVSPPYSSIDLSSLNINEVVGFEGCAKSSGGDSIPVGYSVASGNQYLVTSFEKANSILYISLGSGLSDYNNVFLTIRYTKNT